MNYATEINITNLIIAPISCILNLFLFYLIHNHSSKNLENYKKVLYLGCLTETAFWNLLFSQDSKVIGDIYFVLTCGILGHISSPFSEWFYIGCLFITYFSIVNVAIQFFYRYLILCWKLTLNIAVFMIFVGFGAAPILIYLYPFAYQLITRKKDIEQYKYLLNDTDWVENNEIPTFGIFEVAAFADVLYLSFSITVASCLIVIFCGIAIFRQIMLDVEELSSSVKSCHGVSVFIFFSHVFTLFYSIIIFFLSKEGNTAILPFVTVVFPILLDIIPIMFGIYLPSAGKITFFIGCLPPLINPIVKMFVVSCYRHMLFKLLHCSRKISKTSVQTY